MQLKIGKKSKIVLQVATFPICAEARCFPSRPAIIAAGSIYFSETITKIRISAEWRTYPQTSRQAVTFCEEKINR